jgi:hypothetical protein
MKNSVPRDNGIDADGTAQSEADHFVKCPGCDRWLDMRDLGQVLEHVHGAQIEIIESDMPPRREGPVH